MSLLKTLPHKIAVAAAGIAFLAIPCTPSAKAAANSAPRIVESVDTGRLVTLKGSLRPEARAENDRGRVSPDLQMGDLFLVLRRSPEQQAAFETFLASQQDPSSPNFHHWLTPDEIGRTYGPALVDIDTISRWLQNSGFRIAEVSKDRLSIRFGGTASQVEAAFHTEIHNLQVKNGHDTAGNIKLENHFANMSQVSIPAALTPVVVGPAALHNFFAHPQHKMGSAVRRNSSTGKWERIPSPTAAAQAPAPTTNLPRKVVSLPQFNTGGGTPANIEDIGPYDFAKIYNILPLWTASTPIDGTGSTIAIAGTSNIELADVATFRSAFGLPVVGSANPTYKAPKVIVTNSDPGVCPTTDPNYPGCLDDLFENTLDVEWSGAVAKNAQIVLVTSAATTSSTDSLLLSEQYIVNNVTASIMNVSYGECELGLGTENALYNSLWSTAQGAGIAVFISTGDSGSALCDAGGDSVYGVPYGAQFGLSVSGIASTPYNTAVGGTDLNWDADQAKYWSSTNDTNLSSALGYIPEVPWNDTCSNPILVDSINSQLKENLTAAQVCDEIGNQQITSSSGSILGLVDTVGGSGGKSACIDGDGANLSSCTKGYPKPSWQAGVTGIPADGARDIPDVSFFASNGFFGSAYVVCVSAAGSCTYTAGTEPTGEEVGGTSVSSPTMAGVMALINQKAAISQGNPNVILYQLAAKESYSGCSAEAVPLTGSSCVFNDVDQGTIAMPCDVGYQDCTGASGTTFSVLPQYAAAAGFDRASGLGSLNVANLVTAYATAVAPVATLSPTSLTFASTPEGTAAATQQVTLKNTGIDPLAISGITVTGSNASSFSQTSNCPASLTGAATCTITVGFTPTAVGPFTATISVADNAAGSPQTVSLAGSGAEIGSYSLSASAANPASVAAGSSASSTITATPSGGYTNNSIALTCSVSTISGGTAPPTCSVTGSPIAITTGPGTATVTFNTTAPTTLAKAGKIGTAQLQNRTKGWLAAGGTALACVLFFGIPARRRNWNAFLGLLILFAGLGTIAGCGGGGGGTVTQPIPGTSAGTYTVTVNGVDAASVKQSTTFTVVVN